MSPSAARQARVGLAVAVVALLAFFAARWLDRQGTRPPRPNAEVEETAKGGEPGVEMPVLPGQPAAAARRTAPAGASAGSGEHARAGAEADATAGAALDAAREEGSAASRAADDRALEGGGAPADPLAAATGLAGRVEDRDGRPVEGVRVRALPARGPLLGGPGGAPLAFEAVGPGGPLGGGSGGPGGPGGGVTTDAAGRFELRGLDAAERYRLSLAPPEAFLAAARPAPALVAGEVVDAGSIRLVRAGAIHGQVLDGDGHPVAGAKVRLGDPLPDGMHVFRSSDGGEVGAAMVMVTMDDGPPGEGEGGGHEGGGTPAPSPAPSPAGAGSGGGAESGAGPTARSGMAVGVRRRGPGGPGSGGGAGMPAFPFGDDGQAVTDAAGRFRLGKVAPGTHKVSARKHGLRDAIAAGVEVEEGGDHGPVELRMARALVLEVTVVSGGAPVAGATVQVETAGTPFLPARLGGRGRTPTTDALGKARLENLPSREVELVVDAAGFVRHQERLQLLEEGTSTRTVTLQGGATVGGRIVSKSSATPLARAMVTTRSSPGDGHDDDGPALGRAMGGMPEITGEDGRFELRGLAPGLWTIDVFHGAFAQRRVGPFALRPEQVLDLGDLALDPQGAIEVAVIDDSSGAPIGGAAVEVSPEGSSGFSMVHIGTSAARAAPAGEASPGAGGGAGADGDGGGDADVSISIGMGTRAVTSAAGLATLYGIEPGKRLQVKASKAGYAAGYARGVVLPADATAPLALTIALGQGGRVEGVARRADGAPAGGAAVALLAEGQAMPSASTLADPAGHFRFEEVSPGRYRLRAGPARPWPALESAEPFAVEAGLTVAADAIEAPTGTVRGSLVGPDGAPAEGVRVALGALVGGGGALVWPPFAETQTGPGGAFALGPVPVAGAAGLEATLPAGTRALFALDLGAATAAEVALRLPAGADGRVAGLVTGGAGGGPLAAAAVELTLLAALPGAPAVRRTGTSGADGAFLFEGLPAGRYRLEAGAPGHARDARDLDLAEGAEVAVRLALPAVGYAVVVVEGPGPSGPPGASAVEVEARQVDGGGDGAALVHRASGSPGEPVALDGLRAGAAYEVRATIRGVPGEARGRVVADGGEPAVLRLRIGG